MSLLVEGEMRTCLTVNPMLCPRVKQWSEGSGLEARCLAYSSRVQIMPSLCCSSSSWSAVKDITAGGMAGQVGIGLQEGNRTLYSSSELHRLHSY